MTSDAPLTRARRLARDTRLRKVRRDVAGNPTRSGLVVASIAVGVFAFGSILGGPREIMRLLRTSYRATNPASATLHLATFDDDLVTTVEGLPGVAQARGIRSLPVRIQRTPTTWQEAVLYVLPDDGVTNVDIVVPWRGAWPVPDHALLVERASLGKVGARVGDTVRVALPGGETRDMPLAGLAHDLSLPPAVIAGQAFGYINAETLEWLGAPAGYNQLAIVVDGDRTDEAHIRAVAEAVRRVVERGGLEVTIVDVPTPPLQHPVEAFLPTIMALLTIIGSLALLISTFLIVNTVAGILTEQHRQIGVMMAVGARPRQIGRLYYTLAAAFGLLALVFAAPLSVLGARGLTAFAAGQLNVDIAGFRMPARVLLAEVGASLLVPIAAAWYPIRGVVRRPIRIALAGATADPISASPVDHVLPHLPLSPPSRMALRNVFRHRGRLARTLIGLALGGAVFIAAMTLRRSLFTTLDLSIASQRYDVEVALERPYRTSEVERSALSVPGVTSVEVLLQGQAFPVRADGTTAEAMTLRAMPADTTMFAPRMSAGRWLLPSDREAVVLSTNIRLKQPGTKVGDTMVLKIGDDERPWRVVGLIEELMPPINPVLAYVTYDAYTNVAGGQGRTDTLRIGTTGHDPASHEAAVEALDARLAADGYEVRQIRSRSQDRAILAERFNIIGALLTILAVIIATVGGLGLAGTLSLNVLERTREIAVMRAVGASDGAVRQIVTSEGLAMGLLSWAMATALSVPLSYALCYRLGKVLLDAPLAWTYAAYAVAVWLGVVLAIAVLASVLPARSAVRISVRTALAYE